MESSLFPLLARQVEAAVTGEVLDRSASSVAAALTLPAASKVPIMVAIPAQAPMAMGRERALTPAANPAAQPPAAPLAQSSVCASAYEWQSLISHLTGVGDVGLGEGVGETHGGCTSEEARGKRSA